MEQQQKRKRIDFDSKDVEILEQVWRDGLRSICKKNSVWIHTTAEKLGTTETRVEQWIGNRNKKQKRLETGNPLLPKKTAYVRGPSSFSLFAKKTPRGSLSGPAYMKKISDDWRGLSKEEQGIFKEEAASIRMQPLKGRSRADTIKTQLHIIDTAINVLGSVGVEFAGMGVDKLEENPLSLLATPAALDFLTCKLQDDFRLFVKAGNIQEPSTICANKEGEKAELRKKVRAYFQACWFKATGSKGAIPYQRLAKGVINLTVNGMPEGQQLKDPSCYGINTMKAILKAPLRFEICECAESSVAAIPSSTSTTSNVSVDNLPIEVNSVANAVAIPSTSTTSNLSEDNLPIEVNSLANAVAIPSTSTTSNLSEDNLPIEVNSVTNAVAIPSTSTTSNFSEDNLPIEVTSVANTVAIPSTSTTSNFSVDNLPIEDIAVVEALEIISTKEESENITTLDPENRVTEVIVDKFKRGTRLRQKDLKPTKQSGQSKVPAEEKQWPIKKLTSMKMKGSKRFFKVMWKGHHKETWEPEDFITQDAIESFLNENINKKKSK